MPGAFFTIIHDTQVRVLTIHFIDAYWALHCYGVGITIREGDQALSHVLFVSVHSII